MQRASLFLLVLTCATLSCMFAARSEPMKYTTQIGLRQLASQNVTNGQACTLKFNKGNEGVGEKTTNESQHSNT